jgi:hypothetical protein
MHIHTCTECDALFESTAPGVGGLCDVCEGERAILDPLPMLAFCDDDEPTRPIPIVPIRA